MYLRESEDIVLDAERILGSDCDPQKSGQGPKAPHVEVCKVEEPVLVDDDAQSVEKDKHTLLGRQLPPGHCVYGIPLPISDTLTNLATSGLEISSYCILIMQLRYSNICLCFGASFQLEPHGQLCTSSPFNRFAIKNI
jgi:hypothetical protein